jgi:hypothetical protein
MDLGVVVPVVVAVAVGMGMGVVVQVVLVVPVAISRRPGMMDRWLSKLRHRHRQRW